MGSIVPHLINGVRVQGTGRTSDVYNPSTGAVSKQVALADAATLQQAIEAAKAAFPAWRKIRARPTRRPPPNESTARSSGIWTYAGITLNPA